MRLWAGMQSRRGNKQFDPIFAKWSRSGQLIIGLADGDFALWDSATGQVAKSSKGNAHKSAVTCGDWLYHIQGVSPMPTLALALASDSKIMFTPDICSPKPQAKELSLVLSSAGAGNELNESMIEIKVKKGSSVSPVRSPKKLLRKRTFKAPVSQEGLQFDNVHFSPSGAFLAVLANYVGHPDAKLVITYTTSQAQTTKGKTPNSPARTGGGVTVSSGRGVYQTNEDGTPRDVAWMSEYQVLVSVYARQGGSLQKLSAISQYQSDDACFPAEDSPGPGQLLATAASVPALDQPPVITTAYLTSDAWGLLIVLDFDFEVLARYPLDTPPISLQLPATATEVSLCFEGGGVKVLELPEQSKQSQSVE